MAYWGYWVKNLRGEKYDLGLISENIPDKNDPVKNERILSLKIIAENVRKYTTDYNLNTVIMLKRDPDTNVIYGGGIRLSGRIIL